MRGQIAQFRRRLLDWFAQSRRDLPWRAAPSLYKTVVSEFMLQQTQVDTVLPYFGRWMRRFPDFAALAAAPEADVLKHWEGLGYYSRARNLHRLARSIVSDGIPADPAGWRARQGIGPYTAAAISSIAQGQPEPVIDGNVVRVLCRLANDASPLRSSAEAHKRLLPLARQLIDPARPGPFNEALMELGATICKKARPACLLCPVNSHCAAREAGAQEAVPVIVRKASTRRSIARLWALRDGKLLLHFHPHDATRLAGLAELPLLETVPDSPPLLTRSRGISNELIREFIHALPPADPLYKKCMALSHTRWVPLADLATISLSAPHRRWIQAILDGPGP